MQELSLAHFRKFHGWIARQGAEFSSKWQNDRVALVKDVLKFVRKKYPEWPWLDGMLEWADSYEGEPYKPKQSNRMPMPPGTFKTPIKRCRVWKRTSVQQFDPESQSGRAQRLQVEWKRRDGIQFEAILRVGLNASLDAVDIQRLTWGDFELDTSAPHLRLARRKVERRSDEAAEGIAPLLASTIEALKQCRTYEKPHGGPVFRTVRKGRYCRNRVSDVSDTMKRLRKEAGVEDCWSFKHLRNVGPTLARRARLSSDEREAFLGHVVGGTSRFHEGDVDEKHLIPLVNLIGEKQFDGEKAEAGRGGSIRQMEEPQMPASHRVKCPDHCLKRDPKRVADAYVAMERAYFGEQ